MAERIPIRVTRPYSSVEEFVGAEGWTIGKNGIVLIGHPPLAAGTEVRCELTLASGEPLIRAEGVVVRQLDATGPRPGGLQIRLQRMTPATKAFLKRAGELRSPGEAREPSEPQASLAPPRPRSAPAWKRPSTPGSLDALRIRAGVSIPPPVNREELLKRLRERTGSGRS
jgi:hypothetical protein